MLKAGAVQNTRTSAFECEQSDFPQHKVVIVTPDVVRLLLSAETKSRVPRIVHHGG